MHGVAESNSESSAVRAVVFIRNQDMRIADMKPFHRPCSIVADWSSNGLVLLLGLISSMFKVQSADIHGPEHIN